ncbi:MAG: hypothetical protein J2P21_22635 [Chloracidobacterium sp.]|nr:hypothetical protein [Chloracidobacterium sp.]
MRRVRRKREDREKIGATFQAARAVIGDKLGLYRAMAELGRRVRQRRAGGQLLDLGRANCHAG